MEGDFDTPDGLGQEITTFPAACTASTHTITSKMPTSIMFGKELCLTRNLLFRASSDKEQPMNDYMTDLVVTALQPSLCP
jgi:hypothetical protein